MSDRLSVGVQEMQQVFQFIPSTEALLLRDWYVGDTPVILTGRWSTGYNAHLFQWVLLLICNTCCIGSV